jgi:hypothetical protein
MKRVIVVLMGMFLLLPFVYGGCPSGGGGSWTELITNGGFEEGDLTAWTVALLPGAAGDISVVDSTVVPSSGATIAGPSEGTYYALADQDENFAGVIFQYFTVPDGDDEIELTFDMFVLDLSEEGPQNEGFIGYAGVDVDNQHVRVDVLSAVAGTFDVGSGVIRNLYLNIDGYYPILPYISHSFDLSSDLVAGETYMLRFAESSSMGYMNMGIDNVSVRSR